MMKEEELTKEIKKAFPDLEWGEVRIADKNWDFKVVLLDDKYVFRFPRDEETRKNLAEEIEILKELRKSITVEIPNYKYIAKDKSFAGYDMIKGKEAREELVNSLSFLEKEKVVKQLANFLTELHRFPYEKLNKKPVAEGDDKKYYEKIKIKIEKLLPGKIGAKEFQDIQNFCPNFQKIYATKLRTLIHGDLRGDNFLFADGKIAVIDFSNLSVNDPANDFKGFWTYGCDFAEDIYAKYKGEKDDGFLERSRLHNKMSGIHVLLGSIEDEHCPFPFEEGYRLFKKIFYSC